MVWLQREEEDDFFPDQVLDSFAGLCLLGLVYLLFLFWDVLGWAGQTRSIRCPGHVGSCIFRGRNVDLIWCGPTVVRVSK